MLWGYGELANNEHNSGRAYLADEVSEQRKVLTDVGNRVAGIDSSVAALRRDHDDERSTARQHRQGVRTDIADIGKKVEAQRGEQGQVVMSITAMQADLASMSKTLSELQAHEQQLIGAGKAIAQIGRLGWIIVCGIGAAMAGLIGWIAAHIR